MAIITQTDKRTGITYAYETQYHRNKEKRQSRAKRVCVGKVAPATGKIVPAHGKTKKEEGKAAITAAKKWNFTYKHPYGADIASPQTIYYELTKCST